MHILYHKKSRDVKISALFTISLQRLQSIYIYKKAFENKKAETVASTFDMMLMIIENRIKELEGELSETHNLVES